MSLGLLYKAELAGAPPTLQFGGPRIPRETFQTLRRADEMLREAEAAATRLREQTAALLGAQRQQAHNEGFARGRNEALAAVLGTLEVERRLRELLSHRLADIVEHCVRSLVGELGEAELLRRRILHLLRTGGAGESNGETPERGATLYLHSELLAQLRPLLTTATPEDAPLADLLLVADERRPRESLLLELRTGFVESDFTLTLQEARTLVQQAVQEATRQRDAAGVAP
jgi:hypothetical protein